jgi:hypothetical protein
MKHSLVVALLLTVRTTLAVNFPYESVQLQPWEVWNNSDILFGNGSSTERPPCKNYPGYDGWPSSTRWSAFNDSLGGSLLRGIPPAAACYEGEYKDTAKCNAVRRSQNDALFA